MKKNILNTESRALMLKRISELWPDSQALWGKMNAPQCICHLADQLRMALGTLPVEGKPSFLGRTLIRMIVLMGAPAPKGKASTAPELDQLTAGTKPTNFEDDRKALYHLLDVFLAKSDNFMFQRHPFFGDLNKHQWGKMIWSHLDHHLSQFGV
jgi:hypothetical protein